MQPLALLHLRLRRVNMPVWRWPNSKGKEPFGTCLLFKALVEDLQVAFGVRRALTAAPAQLPGACIAASAPVDIKQECEVQADSAHGRQCSNAPVRTSAGHSVLRACDEQCRSRFAARCCAGWKGCTLCAMRPRQLGTCGAVMFFCMVTKQDGALRCKGTGCSSPTTRTEV
jgi:hypothetical protein